MKACPNCGKSIDQRSTEDHYDYRDNRYSCQRKTPNMDKEYLNLAAREIEKRLPDNHLFILMVAPIGEEGRLSYVSSMRREDAINVLKEFLITAGAAEDWMKHIK